LLLAGEEVAWGQWIVGKEALPTPSWLEDNNKQGDLGVHNVGELHNYGSGWFRQAFGGLGLVGILVSFWPSFRKLGAPLILLPWFLIIFVINFYQYHFYTPWGKTFIMMIQLDLPEVPNTFSELSELMIGVSAFLFVWLNARRMLSSTPRASSVGNSGAAQPSDPPR
jgi:hypothetical protein